MFTRIAGYVLTALAAAALVSGCSSEDGGGVPADLNAGSFAVRAIIEDEVTRTSLARNENGYSVLWEEGDVIGVSVDGRKLPAAFTLSEGACTGDGLFLGDVNGSSFRAKYPFRASDRFSASGLTTSLDPVQDMRPGDVDRGAAVMFSPSSSADGFRFRNLCSVLRIPVTGNVMLDSVVLETGSASVHVSGRASVTMRGATPVLEMDDSDTAGTPRRVTMRGGLQLSPEDTVSLMLVIPAQTYTRGFTVTLYSGSIQESRSTQADVAMLPSRVYGIAPVDLTVDPSLYVMNGQGTESSPFLIETAEDLVKFRDAVNSVASVRPSKGGVPVPAASACYLVTNNISLMRVCSKTVGNWIPIGDISSLSSDPFDRSSDAVHFRGTLSGGGHTVSDLYIDSKASWQALFGAVEGRISDLHVIGRVTGSSRCAMLAAACLDAEIDGCTAEGTVISAGAAGISYNMRGGTVRNCLNLAYIDSGKQYYFSGGIVGTSTGLLDGCLNRGAVSGSTYSGGIVGKLTSSLESSSSAELIGRAVSCVNTGDVKGVTHVGGIAGYVSHLASVENSMNTAQIEGGTSDGGIAGTAVGYSALSGRNTAVTNCLDTGKVTSSGVSSVNGTVCGTSSADISLCYWTTDAGSVSVGAGTAQPSAAGIAPQTAASRLYAGQLYTSGNDIYVCLIDALNAWAADNSASDLPMHGWAFPSAGSYPELTSTAAVRPKGVTHTLSFTERQRQAGHKSCQLTLTLTSNVPFTLIMPDWISEVSRQAVSISEQSCVTEITLAVDGNTTGQERSAAVTASSPLGLTASATVLQSYRYYSTDFSADMTHEEYQTHTDGSGISVIFMGDAYTDRDIADGTYRSDMIRGAEAFFGEEPYKSFRNLFDIHIVYAVSYDSVISQEDTYSTVFSTRHGDGTSVTGDHDKVIDYAFKGTGIPYSDAEIDRTLIIVLMNERTYAGTCTMYFPFDGTNANGMAIAFFPLGTTDTGQTSFTGLIRHEAGGHGFAKLSDEYSYESYGAIPSSRVSELRERQGWGWAMNVDFTPSPASVLWSRFIDDSRYVSEGIGVYEGACTYWTGAYRPTENSLMRHNTGSFNAPSRQAIYSRIHSLAYGSAWSFDYEEFTAWDEANRGETRSSGHVLADFSGQFIPTAPPRVLDVSSLPGKPLRTSHR